MCGHEVCHHTTGYTDEVDAIICFAVVAGQRGDALKLLRSVQDQTCLSTAAWSRAYSDEEFAGLLAIMTSRLAEESTASVLELLVAFKLVATPPMLSSIAGHITTKMALQHGRSDDALVILGWAGLEAMQHSIMALSLSPAMAEKLQTLLLSHFKMCGQHVGSRNHQLAQHLVEHFLCLHLVPGLHPKPNSDHSDGSCQLLRVQDIPNSQAMGALPEAAHVQQALDLLDAASLHVQLRPDCLAALLQKAEERQAWGVASEAARLGSQHGALPPLQAGSCAIAALSEGQTLVASQMLGGMLFCAASSEQQASSSADAHQVRYTPQMWSICSAGKTKAPYPPTALEHTAVPHNQDSTPKAHRTMALYILCIYCCSAVTFLGLAMHAGRQQRNSHIILAYGNHPTACMTIAAAGTAPHWSSGPPKLCIVSVIRSLVYLPLTCLLFM
jgi:hypothetical protein